MSQKPPLSVKQTIKTTWLSSKMCFEEWTTVSFVLGLHFDLPSLLVFTLLHVWSRAERLRESTHRLKAYTRAHIVHIVIVIRTLQGSCIVEISVQIYFENLPTYFFSAKQKYDRTNRNSLGRRRQITKRGWVGTEARRYSKLLNNVGRQKDWYRCCGGNSFSLKAEHRMTLEAFY